jgi:hypothetical protein
MFAEWKAESDKIRDQLVIRQRSLKEKQSRLIDSYMEGIIGKDDYFERKQQLILEEHGMKEKIQAIGQSPENLTSKFDEFIQLANSAYLSFKSAPYEMKRETVDLVTANFIGSGRKVDIQLHPAFELLAARPLFTAGRANREACRTFSAVLSQIFATMRDPAPAALPTS